MKYLITFNSTTATLQAEKYLRENRTKFYGASFSIEAIPYALANTCYGLGLFIECSEPVMKEIFEGISLKGIDTKHFWEDVHQDGNYIKAEKKLKDGDGSTST